MKKATIVVALALVLTFAFATGALATTGKFFTNSQSYYTWYTTTLDNNNIPGGPAVGTGRPAPLFNIGANPANPGAHANYLANTAKCGMCHSVHRASAAGTKLLPTSDATCAGCHTGGTAITARIITWTPYDTAWVPVVDPASPLYPLGSPAWMAASGSARVAAITAASKTAAGGAAFNGGPHNDSALDLIADGIWDGTGTTPDASYELGHRYGCFTRRCHATNPHGADSSKYKIFSAKLLFNESALEDELGAGTYGGLDAVYNAEGATDASVLRFIANNADVVREDPANAGTLQVSHDGGVTWGAPDANETHTLVAGLTCGRPSNPSTGEDECHAEATYAIIDRRVSEFRNHATNSTAGGAYRTDNTGAETPGWGGNDRRDDKTGHVAGTFAANGTTAFAPIASCTSCHDQIDKANTVVGNFTFPHGQAAIGDTNLVLADGVTKNNSLAGTNWKRARIWSGYSGFFGDALKTVDSTPAGMKAYDGNCLKCHRAAAASGLGVGVSF